MKYSLIQEDVHIGKLPTNDYCWETESGCSFCGDFDDFRRSLGQFQVPSENIHNSGTKMHSSIPLSHDEDVMCLEKYLNRFYILIGAKQPDITAERTFQFPLGVVSIFQDRIIGLSGCNFSGLMGIAREYHLDIDDVFFPSSEIFYLEQNLYPVHDRFRKEILASIGNFQEMREYGELRDYIQKKIADMQSPSS